MQRLAEREEDILGFIIRDYVRTAFPVSSGRIFEEAGLEVSPATIRNAMYELGEDGFLEQPHTSSGRIPTDRAYRYFVDNLIKEGKVSGLKSAEISRVLNRAHREHDVLFEKFGKILSEELDLFTGVASFGKKRRVGGYGLEKVLDEPEFDEHELTVRFARMVDNIENLAKSYLEKTPGNAEVFIGDENPSREARAFSAVSFNFKDEELGRCVIFSVGPKRMNYERTLAMFDFISQDIKRDS